MVILNYRQIVNHNHFCQVYRRCHFFNTDQLDHRNKNFTSCQFHFIRRVIFLWGVLARGQFRASSCGWTVYLLCPKISRAHLNHSKCSQIFCSANQWFHWNSISILHWRRQLFGSHDSPATSSLQGSINCIKVTNQKRLSKFSLSYPIRWAFNTNQRLLSWYHF